MSAGALYEKELLMGRVGRDECLWPSCSASKAMTREKSEGAKDGGRDEDE